MVRQLANQHKQLVNTVLICNTNNTLLIMVRHWAAIFVYFQINLGIEVEIKLFRLKLAKTQSDALGRRL